MQRLLNGPVLMLAMVLLTVGILPAGCGGESSGVTLYTLSCAGCHGVAGKGGKATALSAPAYLAAHDDGTIARLTREGIPGTEMRAFGKADGGILTDEQITAIVTYIRSSAAPSK